jgi:hypothetical protein
VRWVGSDGAIGIWSDGSEEGEPNGGAPEANLPGWSTDASKLSAHAVAYWASMGVAICQVAGMNIDGTVSGGGTVSGPSTTAAGQSIVSLGRAIDGVPVVESRANAIFDANDQTTFETFYWPEIPASVVSLAVTFENQLADPAGLATYKAKLPADAQGHGQVVIHHTSAGSSSSFRAAVMYEVLQNTPDGGPDFEGEDLDFDPSGNPVSAVL